MKKSKKLRKTGKQKVTKYKPTIPQQRLLEVLLNPEHRLKSITEICNIAKVERMTYYRAFKNEDFCKYFDRESSALIRKAKASIINASIRAAQRGEAAHTKLLLTMTGDYADRTIFPDGKGKPQLINPQQSKVPMNYLEKATRVAFLLQKGIELKEKAEKDGKHTG